MPDPAAWCSAEALPVWRAGGWLMPVLVALAVAIYYAAAEQWRDARRWPLARMLAWREGERLEDGAVPGELVVLWAEPGDAAIRARRFDRLRRQWLNRFDRRLRYLAILTSAAPLAGLLGTVSGLLTTFRGMAWSGNDLAAGVADGLRQALVTTETGLVIAIPAYIMIHLLRRRRDEWAAAVTHVECVVLRRGKEAA